MVRAGEYTHGDLVAQTETKGVIFERKSSKKEEKKNKGLKTGFDTKENKQFDIKRKPQWKRKKK